MNIRNCEGINVKNKSFYFSLNQKSRAAKMKPAQKQIDALLWIWFHTKSQKERQKFNLGNDAPVRPCCYQAGMLTTKTM